MLLYPLNKMLVWTAIAFCFCDSEMLHESGTGKYLRISLNATHPDRSDKIHSHSYQEMYGQFLIPELARVRKENRGFRLFEIGLGCVTPMKKKGVDVWRALLDDPRDSIWIAEYREKCAKKMIAANMIPPGVKLVYGNQSELSDLLKWHNESGGNFDVIVDDGSHKNMHILTSINFLFVKSLRPGGLYFIEDLQVGRLPTNEDSHGQYIFADVIKDWMEQLMIPGQTSGGTWKHKILPGIKWITCQFEACVVAKCKDQDVARCT